MQTKQNVEHKNETNFYYIYASSKEISIALENQ